MRLCVVLVGLVGCGNPFSQCAGTLTGLYDDAADGGTVSSTLDEDGNLTISLVDADGNTVASTTAPVEEDGTLSTPDGEDVMIDGNFDLESCIAAGNWASAAGSGTWEISQ